MSADLCELLASAIHKSATLVEDVIARSKTVQAQRTALNELISRSKQQIYLISPPKIVRLNIGGKHFNLHRESLNLISDKPAFLSLLSGTFDEWLPKDKSGRIFFDFDFRYMEPYFNLCSDMTMWNGQKSSRPTLSRRGNEILKVEQTAFMKHFVLNRTSLIFGDLYLFHDSIILNKLGHSACQGLATMLSQSNSPTSSAVLLYRGSRDGFRKVHYDKLCHGFPNTICIVSDQSGNAMGGYSSIKWKYSGESMLDEDAFIFTLAEQCHVVVRKHALKRIATSSMRFGQYTCCAFAQYSCYSDLSIEDHQRVSGTLGGAFEINGSQNMDWIGGHSRGIKEVEVYQLLAATSENDVGFLSVPDIAEQQDGSDKFMEMVRQYKLSTPCLDNIQLQYEIHAECIKLEQKERKLLRDRNQMLSDLIYAASFLGLQVPVRKDLPKNNGGQCVKQLAVELQAMMVEIKQFVTLFSAPCSHTVVETVSISTSTQTITTTKATLRQAPEGSPLYNMASDEWGHDLDSDGNIYQDVNSDLFVSIINHLRLKVLLKDTHIEVPPIVVYEDQKTALDNLLSYYMLSDLPIKTLL